MASAHGPSTRPRPLETVEAELPETVEAEPLETVEAEPPETVEAEPPELPETKILETVPAATPHTEAQQTGTAG